MPRVVGLLLVEELTNFPMSDGEDGEVEHLREVVEVTHGGAVNDHLAAAVLEGL